MQSIEAISASDYPLSGPCRQGFDRKPHPVSGGRRFQPLMSSMTPSVCPEISTISNATAPYLRNDGDGGWFWGGRDDYPNNLPVLNGDLNSAIVFKKNFCILL
jgi:hypothetical protein